jgi:plastocyanin
MKTLAFLSKTLSGTVLLLAGGLPVVTFAATQTVTFGNFYYYPISLTVKVGDTVNFTETFGGTHTITGQNRAEPFCGNGAVTNCSVTFNTPGTYPFECLYHASLYSMTGVVFVVTAANVPPTVSITNPTNGAVFAAPATATIQATASDTDGTVTNVRFFENGVSIGSIQKAPYSLVVSNMTSGNYALSAIATDNGGLSRTSSVVTVSVVTPTPLTLSAANVMNGQFQFVYTADPGLRYVVRNSSNLLGWSSVQTNTPASNNVVYSEKFDIKGLRFYRVERLPNP